ncbi:hypothetical protein OESDEN_03326 [Oesophagostomum dentatum]|uniref:G-protein coupled receptors family 1 profile domain-containing protein n=1 Tax=Oesophagostomum dentatum TaxID=61180 RepID=A0A0B1TKV6_OESDE|nr:hypothetical protein OESDEN_03326 [Oesophagostomum dentatum]
MFIAVLSFDRFLAVCRPTRSSALRTRRAATAVTILAWAVVILENIPLLMFVQVTRMRGPGPGPGKRKCLLLVKDEESDYDEVLARAATRFSREFFTFYTFALSYLLPLIAIWFFYSKIIRKLWRRRQQTHLKRKLSKRKTTKVSCFS